MTQTEAEVTETEAEPVQFHEREPAAGHKPHLHHKPAAAPPSTEETLFDPTHSALELSRLFTDILVQYVHTHTHTHTHTQYQQYCPTLYLTPGLTQVG